MVEGGARKRDEAGEFVVAAASEVAKMDKGRRCWVG